MPSFSARSRAALDTVHHDLAAVSSEVIKRRDHSIIFGWRSEDAQNELYPKYSKLKWPESRHNHTENGEPCSLAIDVTPWLRGVGSVTGSPKQIHDLMIKWKCSQVKVEQFVYWTYAQVWERYLAVADHMGIALLNGSNWDGDSIPILDQSFQDLGHIEIVQ